MLALVYPAVAGVPADTTKDHRVVAEIIGFDTAAIATQKRKIFPADAQSGGELPRRLAQAEYRRPASLVQQAGRREAPFDRDRADRGSALSMACAFLGLDCKVFMVRVSYDQSPIVAL